MQRLSRLVLALLILSVPDFAGSSAAAAPPAENPSPVSRAQSPIWRNECIDCPKQYHVLGDHSLALDTRGHPHVVYASDLLYYARYTGSAWEIEELGLAPGSEEIYRVHSLRWLSTRPTQCIWPTRIVPIQLCFTRSGRPMDGRCRRSTVARARTLGTM